MDWNIHQFIALYPSHPMLLQNQVLRTFNILLARAIRSCIFRFWFSFFDKRNILISWRYQLHPASATTQYPSGSTDAQSQNEKKKLKNRSPVSVPVLIEAAQTPPRQHLKSRFFKRDAPKKETVHKHCRCLMVDRRFSRWRKSPLSKQCLLGLELKLKTHELNE
jgi:hypothetical protein